MKDTLREQMLARAEALVNELSTWAADHPEADLDAREGVVLEYGRALLGELLGLLAGAAGARSPACPNCGLRSVRPVQRQRPRTLQTRCGVISIPRQRLSCPGCGVSWQPLDRVLGLTPRQRSSLGAQRWQARLGAVTTFREAAVLLEELTGVAVGAETLRTHAERLGTEVEGRQQAHLAHVQAEQAPPPPAYDPAPGRLLVEADGVMVRYRDRHLDGTRIDGDWHEVKLGLVAGWADEQLQAPSYVAAREPAVRFAQRLSTEAACRGALDVVSWRQAAQDGGGHQAILRPVVILGDGAKWIWDEAAASFGSERTEIVDWYHATEHLWTLAKALHGEPGPTTHTATWQQRAETLLWTRGATALLPHLARLHPATAEAAKTLVTERGYFRTNQQRMRYPTFRQQGLPLGSGAVEAEAKRLVQLRLKRSGMRWSDLGARAILHLRCHSLSGRSFDDLPLAS